MIGLRDRGKLLHQRRTRTLQRGDRKICGSTGAEITRSWKNQRSLPTQNSM